MGEKSRFKAPLGGCNFGSLLKLFGCSAVCV